MVLLIINVHNSNIHKEVTFLKMLERGINQNIVLGEFNIGSLMSSDIRKNR
jgi:hypothetical protein